MRNEIQEFSEQIRRDYPSADPKFTPFPSGAARLDVKVGSETYAMEYLPSLLAVGISRMSTATFGWEGFEHPFDTFHEAREFMCDLLKKALPQDL